MEKYKSDYSQPNRRSRIEELEDNLRVFKRESDLSRQRIERERQTLKYNRSDLSKGSRNNQSNKLYQAHQQHQSGLRNVRIMPQDTYYARERPIAYSSQPLLEAPSNEEVCLRYSLNKLRTLVNSGYISKLALFTIMLKIAE
jgi:hypothetical protein